MILIMKSSHLKSINCFSLVLFSLVLLMACNSPYVHRKKGYFRIDFPAHKYQLFDKPGYPYTFEYPVYATVVQDTAFFEEKPENPYWINIEFPRFNGRIYMSYKEIGKNNFNKLVNDAYDMTNKHSTRANEINDSVMHTPLGLTGIFFNVAGNAASAYQFFVSDSTKHFLRGALYFDAPPNEDSLGIVNDFLKVDVKHLINTLKWRNYVGK